MKKFYSEPELEIRKYSLSGNGVITASNGTGDLYRGDEFDPSSMSSGGAISNE